MRAATAQIDWTWAMEELDRPEVEQGAGGVRDHVRN